MRKSKRIKELKEKHKIVDAAPLVKKCFGLRGASDDERQEFEDDLTASFTEVGVDLVERAYLEKLFTVDEYKAWRDEFGLEAKDMCPILNAYFSKKDGDDIKKNDRIIVVTMIDSPIHKSRHIWEERFNVTVMNIREAMEVMENAPEKTHLRTSKRIK